MQFVKYYYGDKIKKHCMSGHITCMG